LRVRCIADLQVPLKAKFHYAS